MELYPKLHVASFEQAQEELDLIEATIRERFVRERPLKEVAQYDEYQVLEAQEREYLRTRFPYFLILEGGFHEQDFARRWLWRNISPPHRTSCNERLSEFPGCPLTLATECLQREEKAYLDVVEHGHIGVWTSYWLGKTKYDYGYEEYYFVNETDYLRFREAVPTFMPEEDPDF